MSDPKTVEVLSRYKATRKNSQEYLGTHLEEIPKYPSFFSGRGLEPRSSVSSVGFLHSEAKAKEPNDSSTFYRKNGIAIQQIESEVIQQNLECADIAY